jgi:hypothetical protein
LPRPAQGPPILPFLPSTGMRGMHHLALPFLLRWAPVNVWPDWQGSMILLILASWVANITGLSHGSQLIYLFIHLFYCHLCVVFSEVTYTENVDFKIASMYSCNPSTQEVGSKGRRISSLRSAWAMYQDPVSK